MLGEVSYYLIDREFCLGLRGDGVLFFFLGKRLLCVQLKYLGLKVEEKKCDLNLPSP